ATLRIGDLPLGPVGLALGASAGAWLEWILLRRKLAHHMGTIEGGAASYGRMFAAALLAAGAGYVVSLIASDLYPLILALIVGAVFGATYFVAARALGLGEARLLLDSILRRLPGRGR